MTPSFQGLKSPDSPGRFTGQVVDGDYPALDLETFSVENVAKSTHEYFKALFEEDPGGELGFLVGGIGGAESSPEVWQIVIRDGDPDTFENVLPANGHGIVHQGLTDAITRLVDGAGQGLGNVLEDIGALPSGQGEAFADVVRSGLTMTWAWPGMPLGETIDMARFLVDTQINFVRFMPGDAMVGGPIEIAALTKHEGFKWVQRKHYYSPELNPTQEVS